MISQVASVQTPVGTTVSARLGQLLAQALTPTSLHALSSMLGPLAQKRADLLTQGEVNVCLERVGVALRLYGRDQELVSRVSQQVAGALGTGSHHTGAAVAHGTPSAASTQTVPVQGVDDVVRARNTGKELSRKLGFDESAAVRIATAISELARNIVLYAGHGSIVLEPCVPPASPRKGLRIHAHDNGPGITNLPDILGGTYKSARGMGMGLLGVKRLMDEFTIDTAPGRGTHVTVCKWL